MGVSGVSSCAKNRRDRKNLVISSFHDGIQPIDVMTYFHESWSVASNWHRIKEVRTSLELDQDRRVRYYFDRKKIIKSKMADFSASAPMSTFQPGTAAAATSIVELSLAAR